MSSASVSTDYLRSQLLKTKASQVLSDGSSDSPDMDVFQQTLNHHKLSQIADAGQ